jgi:Major Facilitator Superfamily.
VNRDEWTFAVTMSGVHGLDHLAKRLFPPLVPVWAAVFGFPLWQLGVVLGAHTFGSAVGQAPIGHVADRTDRRRLLVAGIALIGVGTAAVGAAPLLRGATVFGVDPAFLALTGATLAAGIGSSAIHPTGYPLISANVSEGVRGKVLGMWGSAARFGDGLAPALVGALLLVVAWPAILAGVGVGVGVAAAVVLVVLRGFDTAPTATEERAGRESVTRDRRTFVYPFAAVTLYFAVQIAATNAVTVFLPQFLTASYDLGGTLGGVALTAESSASFYYAGVLLFAGGFQLATANSSTGTTHGASCCASSPSARRRSARWRRSRSRVSGCSRSCWSSARASGDSTRRATASSTRSRRRAARGRRSATSGPAPCSSPPPRRRLSATSATGRGCVPGSGSSPSSSSSRRSR